MGAWRASLGYPTPWKVKWVEIGNEDNLNNGTASYITYRYKAFADAINKRFPEIRLISSVEPKVFVPPAGVIADYHDYNTPDSLASKFHLFDNFTTPILVGKSQQ